jgi:hypothetical protein
VPVAYKQGISVNDPLTVFLFAPVVAYSSEVQQPMRATAILSRHPHTHWPAPFDREQGRAGSLHPDGNLRPVHSACISEPSQPVLRGLGRALTGAGQVWPKMALPQVGRQNCLFRSSGQGQGRTADLPLFRLPVLRPTDGVPIPVKPRRRGL